MADGGRIRLIALDIDGTLVGQDLVIGPRTRAAVEEAARRGIAVSLVTGRMAVSALPFASALHLTAPIVAQQGALVRAMPPADSGSIGRLLFHRPIPPRLAEEVTRWAYESGLQPHFNYLERLIVQADEPRLKEFQRYVGDRIDVVESLIDRAGQPVTKIVLVADESGHPPPLLDDARARFGDRVSVTLSHPRFLEILAPGISKGFAIRWLARRLGVPIEETLAVGDQHNDLEMIAEAGHGVAMPTAPAIVLAAAKYIARPVEEEGVAQIIEQLALGGDVPDISPHVSEATAVRNGTHDRPLAAAAGPGRRPRTPKRALGEAGGDRAADGVGREVESEATSGTTGGAAIDPAARGAMGDRVADDAMEIERR